MAEIAFETIVRVIIAIVVLSTILSLLSVMHKEAINKIEDNLGNGEQERIIDATFLSKKALKALLISCKTDHQNALNEEICYILRNVDKDRLLNASGELNFTYVESISKNTIVSYLVNGSVRLS